MKILIAVPTFETIFPDTFRSVWNLDKCGHETVFEFVRGYDCATARNAIAQKGMDIGAEYIMMVDNDVVVPEDALRNLLEDSAEVCLGYYAHRNPINLYTGKTSVCRLGEFNYSDQYSAEELKNARDHGKYKIRIHGGGMGCALIRTDVFRRLRYPWYDWVNYSDSKRGMLSEDLYFCEQCKNAKIPIYTDTRVGCGHMLRHIQWPIGGENGK